MPTQQRLTADRLVAAFNAMDNSTILSLRSPTCTRTILPASTKFPQQSNDAYRANLDSMAKLFSSFQVTVHDVVEDIAARKIVMFVTAEGETKVGRYVNEYVWKMTFDEEGEKIVDWVEFVDVGMLRDFWPKLRGAQETGKPKATKEEGT